MKTQTQKPDGVDEHARELITLVRPELPWKIKRDSHGFAYAITRDGWSILDLEAGTTRNEHCVETFVAMLNGAKAALVGEAPKTPHICGGMAG